MCLALPAGRPPNPPRSRLRGLLDGLRFGAFALWLITRGVGQWLAAMLHESLPKRVNCSCLGEWPARLSGWRRV